MWISVYVCFLWDLLNALLQDYKVYTFQIYSLFFENWPQICMTHLFPQGCIHFLYFSPQQNAFWNENVSLSKISTAGSNSLLTGLMQTKGFWLFKKKKKHEPFSFYPRFLFQYEITSHHINTGKKMVLAVFNASRWYLNAFNESSCNICSLAISVLTFIYTNNQQGIAY